MTLFIINLSEDINYQKRNTPVIQREDYQRAMILKVWSQTGSISFSLELNRNANTWTHL